ncbi:MAG: hypothetical protein AABY22_12000 [Nanoarchaeota archaeon]
MKQNKKDFKKVYLVYTGYEEFEIFSTKTKAEKFINEYAKINFPKSGLFNNKSEIMNRKYNIKDFIQVRNLVPQEHVIK